MGKIPKEVYREAEDDLETLWKKAMEYGDFPAASSKVSLSLTESS